ncbi:transcriptional regulator HexR [Oceanisphaera pacifica]|uniref:Transcriptional regulator HexR n=1 Tax=Oceanisphaera pacifica TaxID=2818389 RepID=A0ABS3NI08_9GAMM|nr:transcriptional regulator HexR [Oceanisphaera pacifica]MBO1520226.1 transcriptional regulator HexR [Oceanisphaera pacifica]
MNILEKITQQLDDFSKSEKKVADAIMAAPQTAIHSSIAALAKIADVSEPTVNRFCRRLDTKGFPDFKLHLAQSLANTTTYVHRQLDENDSPESYIAKTFESSMACLSRAQNSLDPQQVNRAVNMLTQAKQLSFFGLGASSAVAHDATNKFFRFSLPVQCFDDPVMMRMSAANSSPDQVFVLISYTGRTKALVEIAHLARQKGALVLGLTAKDSPLANAASMVLSMDIPNDVDLHLPMASRLTQMVLIDVLATGFILRRGNVFIENLQKVKEGIKNSQFDSP